MAIGASPLSRKAIVTALVDGYLSAYGFLMVQQLRHPEGAGKKTPHDAKTLPYPRIASLAAAQRTQRHVPSSIIQRRRVRVLIDVLAMLPTVETASDQRATSELSTKEVGRLFESLNVRACGPLSWSVSSQHSRWSEPAHTHRQSATR